MKGRYQIQKRTWTKFILDGQWSWRIGELEKSEGHRDPIGDLRAVIQTDER